MKSVKNWLKGIIIAIALFLKGVIIVKFAVFIYKALPWILIFLYLLFIPTPASPEVTYGEFPFEITYSVDGEIYEIRDTLICEYAGIGSNEGSGKFRKWESHLKSGGEQYVVLWQTDNLHVYCSVGDACYYMDDMEQIIFEEYIPSNAIKSINVIEKIGEKKAYLHLNHEQLYEEYGIEIISWNFAEPIDNTFSW